MKKPLDEVEITHLPCDCLWVYSFREDGSKILVLHLNRPTYRFLRTDNCRVNNGNAAFVFLADLDRSSYWNRLRLNYWHLNPIIAQFLWGVILGDNLWEWCQWPHPEWNLYDGSYRVTSVPSSGDTVVITLTERSGALKTSATSWLRRTLPLNVATWLIAHRISFDACCNDFRPGEAAYRVPDV